MSEKNIKSFIDELIKEVEDELDEANVTGNVDGYDTPNAFSGKNSDKKRKKTATQFGYTLVNNDINNIDESINEDKVYIDFLNKKKGFKQDRIKFNSYEDAVKWAKKNFDKFDPDMIKYESVNEASLQKGKTYGGSKCEGGCFIGKEGLKKIIKISKDSPKDVFMFRDDNYSGLQPHFIKDGVIAKATTINPAYDLEKNKVRSLNIDKDVILSVRLFVSTNESVTEAKFKSPDYIISTTPASSLPAQKLSHADVMIGLKLAEKLKNYTLNVRHYKLVHANGKVALKLTPEGKTAVRVRTENDPKYLQLIQNTINDVVSDYVSKIKESVNEVLDPKAQKFLDAIQVNDRSIKDLKNITVDATPQGNWSVYYKGKRMFTLNGKMLDDKTIMKYGLEHMDESLSEGKKIQRPVNRWLELKNDESMHANKKLATGLRELKYQLKEVETFFRCYNQIKTMNELSSDTFWKRTHGHIYKIKERLINIAKTIQEIEK